MEKSLTKEFRALAAYILSHQDKKEDDIADHGSHDAIHFFDALRQGHIVVGLFQMDDVVADVGAVIGNPF